MAQNVRIKKTDLPSKIDIESAKIIDMGLQEKIISYSTNSASGSVIARTSKSHNFIEGTDQDKTQLIISDLPIVVTNTNTVYASVYSLSVGTITNISGNGTYITVTTSAPHNLLINDKITITGVISSSSPSLYNGTFLINSIVNDTTFKIAGFAKEVYTSGGTIKRNQLRLSSLSPSLIENSMIQFTGSPVGAIKNKTYYLSNIRVSESSQYFDIKESINSSYRLSISSADKTKISLNYVIDPNSPRYESNFSISFAYSGQYNLSQFTNNLAAKQSNTLSNFSYATNSKYITYVTEQPHSYTIFDLVTVENTEKQLGAGAINLFDSSNAKIVSVTEYSFTVKLDRKISGVSYYGRSRVISGLPLDVIAIPALDQVEYQFTTVQTTPISQNVEKLNITGYVHLYYQNISDRYYIKYSTIQPHNLIKNDFINIYDINPSSFNIANKKIGNDVTLKTFSFKVSFSSSDINNSELIYLFSEPKFKDNNSINFKYISGGFLSAVRYFIRYRLKSIDNNIVSKWSTMFTVENQHPEDIAPKLYDGGSNG